MKSYRNILMAVLGIAFVSNGYTQVTNSQSLCLATAVIRVVVPETSTNQYTVGALRGMMQTHAKFLGSKPVLYTVIQNLMLLNYWGKRYKAYSLPMTREEAFRRIEDNLTITPTDALGLIEIRYQSEDVREAARVANEIAIVYIELAKKMPGQVSGERITLVDPAKPSVVSEHNGVLEQTRTTRITTGVSAGK